MAPTAPAKRTTARQKARARSKPESSSGPLSLPLPRPRPNPGGRRDANNDDSSSSPADPDSGFLDSRHDRQLIRRNTFVARVAKSSDKPGHGRRYGAKGLRRRRPSKKLVATLESLGDALDDIIADAGGSSGGASADAAAAAAARFTAVPELEGRIRHRSLGSRPGVLRRKERVVRAEMDLFGRSLARLAGLGAVTGAGGGPSRPATLPPPSRSPATAVSAAPTLIAAVPTLGGGGGGGGYAGADLSTAPSSRFAALRSYITTTMEQSPAFRER